MFYQPIQCHQHLSYNQDTCQYLGYTVLVYQYKLHYAFSYSDSQQVQMNSGPWNATSWNPRLNIIFALCCITFHVGIIFSLFLFRCFGCSVILLVYSMFFFLLCCFSCSRLPHIMGFFLFSCLLLLVVSFCVFCFFLNSFT